LFFLIRRVQGPATSLLPHAIGAAKFNTEKFSAEVNARQQTLEVF
jgi:hypothetical protein